MKIDWKTDDWVKKLRQQAEDSKEYRHKLYERVELKNKKRILDVGCGTGAVTEDLALLTSGEVVGIDNDPEKLEHAKKLLKGAENVRLMEADVLELPFDDEYFDLVVFTIVLVYIKDQQRALNEMARVTKKGGVVLATLEPDYAGRFDYPACPYVPLMLKSMEELGADLYTGRKLKALFNNAGLRTEVGMDTESDFILHKDDTKSLERFQRDFWVFEKLFKKANWSEEKIKKFKIEEINRIKSGQSFHFPPCFYAIGKKT
jgi:ubiquinone/menaquinone biosynthesis C-methylase UbiE